MTRAAARFVSFDRTQIGQIRIAQIEFALDVPTLLVLQFAVAIEVVDEIALGVDQRQLDLVAEVDQLLVTGVAVVAMVDEFEPIALGDADRADDRIRAPGVRSSAGRAHGSRPRARVCAPWNSSFLSSCRSRRPGVGETQRAGDPGQRQAFADQGHEDHAKGQKQDQVAVRKGASVRFDIGNRKRRRQRDDAADSGESERKQPLPGRQGIAAPDPGKSAREM